MATAAETRADTAASCLLTLAITVEDLVAHIAAAPSGVVPETRIRLARHLAQMAAELDPAGASIPEQRAAA